MERVLSAEEKIRRAEEIYERRRNQNYKNTTATVNVSGNNRDFKLLKKMIIQVLICLLIYFIFYLIQTTNYVFSASTLNKTKEILDYDMDVKGIYTEIRNNFINDQEDKSIENTINQENINEENISNDEKDDNVEASNQNTDNSEQNNIEENKAEGIQQENKEEANLENINNETENKEETNLDETKVEIDNKEIITLAQEILNNYSIIKPANGGFISSEFGTREEEGDIVTSYHHGIDIGVITGTDVMASTDGEVILAAESSSYGKYMKIQNGDLVTLYAHCNELLLNVGDTVKQGQIIAKSGATGNVTRTTLTF